MISISHRVVVLDACVLYSAPVRDLILSFAEQGLFKAKWTQEIHNEWIRSLLLKRPDLNRSQLEETAKAMDSAFPDAIVEGYKKIVASLSLPDPKDKHVLACAIKANANGIVTFNLKDFPARNLKPYDLIVQHPDDFVLEMIEANQPKALTAFENQVEKLKNPPLTRLKVIDILSKCGLEHTAKHLKGLSA